MVMGPSSWLALPLQCYGSAGASGGVVIIRILVV